MVATVVYGASGAAIVLVAYLLVLFEKVLPENPYYITANIIGSGLLAWYSILLESIPFLILNLAWVLGSAYDLCRVSVKKKQRLRSRS